MKLAMHVAAYRDGASYILDVGLVRQDLPRLENHRARQKIDSKPLPARAQSLTRQHGGTFSQSSETSCSVKCLQFMSFSTHPSTLSHMGTGKQGSTDRQNFWRRSEPDVHYVNAKNFVRKLYHHCVLPPPLTPMSHHPVLTGTRVLPSATLLAPLALWRARVPGCFYFPFPPCFAPLRNS